MVDATNIQTMPFIVRTDTSGNAAYNNGINFHVIADPKGPPYTPDDNMHFSLGGAMLTIYDSANFHDSNFVSSCTIASGEVPSYMQDIKSPLVKKGAFYEFTVNRNQLTNADFEICYVSRLHPAMDCYRFALPTFVPEPNLGLLLGSKGDKIEILNILPDTPASRAGLLPGLIVQQINGVDSARYGGLMKAQDVFKFGDVDLELTDPSNGKTNIVLLTTARTFPEKSIDLENKP